MNCYYSHFAIAKENSFYQKMAPFPNELINVFTAKQYFIIEANMDKVIAYRLSKITRHLRDEIQERAIPDIRIVQKDFYIDIFIDDVTGSKEDSDRSLKIAHIIDDLPNDIRNGVTLSNESSSSRWQFRVTIPKETIQKELYSTSKTIIHDVLSLNNIHATILPMENNRFFVIPSGNEQIELQSMFKNVGKLSFHLVNTDISRNAALLPSDTVMLPFIFDYSHQIPIYKESITKDLSITKVYSNLNPYLNTYSIYIIFDTSDKKLIENMTRQNISKLIALIIGNKIIFAPRIMSPIRDGKIEINGNISSQQVQSIVNLISLHYIPIIFNITEKK